MSNSNINPSQRGDIFEKYISFIIYMINIHISFNIC